MQLQRRRGDDAQRALAADVEIAQVVAGVVLAQRAQAVPDLALGVDHLQAQAELAHVAVAQHLGAAGIGRQIAAHRAAALGRQAQGEEAPGRLRGLLHRLQQAAGLDRHRVVVGVDLTDAVEPGQQQHDRAAAGVGRGTAAQAGVAALRHDRHAGGSAAAQHRRHLGGAARTHHRARGAAEMAAPVDQKGRGLLAAQHMGGADQGAQALQEIVLAHRIGRVRFMCGSWGMNVSGWRSGRRRPAAASR